ncbi:MAG: DUF255 domain-containing protein [Bacteroidales bacterium]|nr:DUF255 domain-containing protein [Bacteroidales bacterium]
MKIKFLSLIIALFYPLIINAQQNNSIKWLTFEEAEKLDSAEHRPFLIDVYTDWCGWCKRMSATTFANPNIANYINKNFYPIKFDAETSDTIIYGGKEYINEGKANNLAIKLLNGRLSYPTIVYIDRDSNVAPIPGYMEPKDIEPLLVYFAEDVSRNASLEKFSTDFMYSFADNYKDEISKIKEEEKHDTTGKIEWLNFDEAFEKYDKNPKPLLLNVWIDFIPEGVTNSISGNIFERSVLKDSTITNYINKNFYPIKFYAASQDTIKAFGGSFVGSGIGMPHQLTGALMGNNFIFPSMFFFNNKKEFLTRLNGYFQSNVYEIILKFYAEEAYKTQSFQDYYLKNNKK